MTNEQPVSTQNNQIKRKLIRLDSETRPSTRPNDINIKINTLESSLSALQGELETVNQSVVEGLDRLSDNDLDITAKVSETYKRLGEIDNTYKSLSKISGEIDSEVKKLALEMEEVADQSAAELGRLETTSSTQIKETNLQHEQLVVRVNKLIEHSRETNNELSKSIKENTDALQTLEKQLLLEINTLANSTEQRDNELASDVSAAVTAIEKNRARIIQMQSVDEALSKRATLLEITVAELTDHSQKMQSSVNLLDARTNDLSSSVINLNEEIEQHTLLIAEAQQRAEKTDHWLLSLTNLEKFHFRTLSGGLVLVLLLITALYMYQQETSQNNNLIHAENTQLIDQKVANLQQQVVDRQNKQLVMNERFQNELQNINDQTTSMDARISQSSPFSQFGPDNIVHGAQWIAKQPASNYAIQLAIVKDKQQMFELVRRYSYYLKEPLAYYVLDSAEDKKFVLIYGSFKTNKDLSSAQYRMPGRINFQRTNVVRIANIQKVL